MRAAALSSGLAEGGRTRRVLAAGLIALACCACASSRPAAPPPVRVAPPAAAIAVTTLWTSQRGVVSDEPMTETFRDAAAFAAWWQTAAPGADAIPSVDFTSQVVVAISSGAAPNGCHSVAVTGATRDADSLVVQVERRLPAPSAICAQMIVHPVVVVALPLPVRGIRLQWRDAPPARP